MGFKQDYPETEEEPREQGEWTPIPEGFYVAAVGGVREKDHERGPMFGIKLAISEGEYVKRVVWANVIFLPYFTNGKPTAGAGIARSFLKAVKQPYKGEGVEVEPKNWKDQTLGIKVTVNGKYNNVVAFYDEVDYEKAQKSEEGDESLPEPETAKTETEQEPESSSSGGGKEEGDLW